MSQQATAIMGLDIGSYSIKCVELSHSKDVIRLHQVAILPIDGQSTSTVPKSLGLFFQDKSMLSKRIRISLKGASLLIRRIHLPKMTPTELRSAIRFEAEGHIPFSIDDCVLDFQILNESSNEKLMNVLLVAAKREFIQQRLDLLAKTGIKPELIDVDVFCLVNAFRTLADEQPSTYGLLNIGHEVSSFAIVHDHMPYFVREIPFGGNHVTKVLEEQKGITQSEADQMKIAASSENLAVIKLAVQKGFEPLADELTHSIDFFENESGEGLKSIWLSGGGALTVGTCEFLSQTLERQVSLWDNLKKIEMFGQADLKFFQAHSHELNVALGMVLRGLGVRR